MPVKQATKKMGKKATTKKTAAKPNGRKPRIKSGSKRKYSTDPNAYQFGMDEAEAYRYDAMDTRVRNTTQGVAMMQLRMENTKLQISKLTTAYNEQVEKYKDQIRTMDKELQKLAENVNKHNKELMEYREYLAEKYKIKGGHKQMTVDPDLMIIRQIIKDEKTGKETVA